MRSRAELALRVLGLGSIAAWIALALVPRAVSTPAVSVATLARALPEWTVRGAPAAVHVRLDSIPDARTTDWLSAVRRAGSRLTWDGSASPLAFEAFRSASPRAPIVVLTSGDGGAILHDALGVLDTVRADGAVRLASVEGALTLRDTGVMGRVEAPAVGQVRSVHVSGAAGWEAKFVIAALEEAGWVVDARLFVAPGHDIVQGRGGAPDTARHDAVVLLDSAAAEATRGVEGFVRSGGGVVIAGTANRSRRLASLVAWRAGTRELAALGTVASDTTWRGLSRIPLTLVSNGAAVMLEARGSAAAVVARRYHGGRVAAVGYDETWRWRMAGGGNSVAEHREWWSRVVAGVAMHRSAGDQVPSGTSPVAALYDRLGPPSAMTGRPASSFPRDSIATVLAVLGLAALLSEWMMRRARGAR